MDQNSKKQAVPSTGNETRAVKETMPLTTDKQAAPTVAAAAKQATKPMSGKKL